MKLLTLLTLLSFGSFASIKNMVCHTPRMEKSFALDNKRVTLFEENLDKDELNLEKANRAIASNNALVSIQNIRTKEIGSSVTKVLNFEGHKYTIHIANKKQPNSNNDYLSIKSRKGHEILYPIDCQ